MRARYLLVAIMLGAFLFRLILAAQSPTLSYDAYPTIRQIEHIQETGMPLFEDSLSFGGRFHIVLPVFPYLMAFSTLFMPENIAYVIIPNLLAVALHGAIFWMVYELTNHKGIGLLAALASVFIPTYVSSTLLTVSSLSLAIPLLIILCTLFLKLRKSREKRMVLLLTYIVLCFTHSLALLCIPFFILTVVLATIKGSKDTVTQREFALFAVLFATWLYVILYKRSLATIGFETLRGNVPPTVVAGVYGNISILPIATAIGIIPFGLALYAAYREGAGEHIGIQAVLALALSTVCAMALKLLPLTTGIALFSVVCIILAGIGLQHTATYMRGFRSPWLSRITYTLLGLLFIGTSILPSVAGGLSATQGTVDEGVINAGLWLKENSPSDSLILAQPQRGAAIAYYAQRPVYIDTDYQGRTDAEERFSNAQAILTSAQPSVLAREEKIDYIISDEPIHDACLNMVYGRDVIITKVLCS